MPSIGTYHRSDRILNCRIGATNRWGFQPWKVFDFPLENSGMDIQTLGIEKVVPCPDILEAPASPCNIIHCEPINCEPKLYLESLLVECDGDLLKNQNAKVHRMWSPGQNGYRPLASPVTASPSPKQRESRSFSTSCQTSSRKPKFYDLFGTVRMLREEVKARHGRLRKGYGYHQWLDPGAMRLQE